METDELLLSWEMDQARERRIRREAMEAQRILERERQREAELIRQQVKRAFQLAERRQALTDRISARFIDRYGSDELLDREELTRQVDRRLRSEGLLTD